METMFDLLGLPNVNHVSLHDAPLVLAICQVRFSSMLSVNDPATLSAFQKAVQGKYPLATPGQEVELLFGAGFNDVEIKREQRRSSQWQFTDQEDNWKIVLGQDFLTLETRNYEHFEDFLIRLREALDALNLHIQPTIGTRLGLRYINEVRPASDDHWNWFDIIHTSLLGAFSIPGILENTIQVASMQQLLLRYPRNLGINIHHGLFPNGTTIRSRSKEEMPNNPFYLLDFDVFQDFIFPQILTMDSNEICSHVEEYHKTAYRLFRWSVTDKYIEMREE